MPRTALLIAVAVFALIASLGVLVASVLYTSGGRGFLAGIAEDRIADALGGEVSIGRLQGPLPGYLIATDIALSDEDGAWLTVDRIELRWRPAQVLRARIVVDLAAVEGAALMRAPPEGEDDDEAREPGELRLPRLPDGLPDILIEQVRITDFAVGEALIGVRRTFAASGELAISDQTVRVNATAREGGGSDEARIAVAYDRSTGGALVDVGLDSAADGAIARMIGAEGAVDMRLAGEAPAADFRATLALAAG